jgi:hypothetical protein
MTDRAPDKRSFALASIIFISLGVSPALSSGGVTSGHDLFEQCKAAPDAFYSGACAGYIVGVADAMSGNPVAGFNACIPSGVPRQQLEDVAVKYMTDHPDFRQYTAASLVASALSEGFPC